MVVCGVLLRMDVARNRAWLGVVTHSRVASQARANLADHGLSALYRADYDAQYHRSSNDLGHPVNHVRICGDLSVRSDTESRARGGYQAGRSPRVVVFEGCCWGVIRARRDVCRETLLISLSLALRVSSDMSGCRGSERYYRRLRRVRNR